MKKTGDVLPSIKELGPLCQKPNYKQVGNWYVRHFLRDAALPVTWLLLHTEVTANQVTLVSLFIGMAGAGFLCGLSPVHFLTGALLLQVWYFLDHVDGQIARFRKTACLSGRFFDFLTHHVIHAFIFFMLGFYAFRLTGSGIVLFWGYFTSLFMAAFNLIHDTKYKTFFEALQKTGGVIKKVEGHDPKIKAGGEAGQGAGRKLFSSAHKLIEIHVVMNLLTAGAIAQIFFKVPVNFRVLFFYLYGFVVPVVTAVKISYLITQRKIDDEYQTFFGNV